MNDIASLFRPDSSVFTVFVVEQRFVVGRGHEFFHEFINTSNFFDSDEKIKKRFQKVIDKIEKGVAPVSKVISLFTASPYVSSITDIVTSLCKLFTVNEHQAAGPDVVDPIIIQEGKITKRALTKLVHLHKDSILMPSIIIMLKDNDFDRAKHFLSECPNGINVKMIRNSGDVEIHKVVNCGAEDIDAFINSFAEQCYSTCSTTRKEILLNSEWANDSIVSKFSPLLLRYRTNLLLDQKEETRGELSDLIASIRAFTPTSTRERQILLSLECVAKLYRVFCNDYGGTDILDAARLAGEMNNEVLLAHVYRYAEFLPCSPQEKDELYLSGIKLFKMNGMEDNAIYCRNNMLIQQFYTDHVSPEHFRDMQIEAVSNVPGMVGLSHIYNNVGVAYLYCGQAPTAIDFFSKGLDYARFQDRIVQNLALESNKLIAESYAYSTIDDNRLRFLMRRLFDGMGLNKLPFLGADYAINILSVAYHQNPNLGYEILNQFPVKELVEKAFLTNTMGGAERLLQMQYLASHYKDRFPLLDMCSIPKITTTASGKRMDFILRYGYSPFEFNTWL